MDQNAFKVRWLSVCNNMLSFERLFVVDGFADKFIHIFLMSWLYF